MAQQKDDDYHYDTETDTETETDSGYQAKNVIDKLIHEFGITADGLVEYKYKHTLVRNYILYVAVVIADNTRYENNISEGAEFLLRYANLGFFEKINYDMPNYGLPRLKTAQYDYGTIKAFVSPPNQCNFFDDCGVDEYINNLLLPFGLFSKSYINLIQSIRDYCVFIIMFIGIENTAFILNTYMDFAMINWRWTNDFEEFKKKFIYKISQFAKSEKAVLMKSFNQGLYASSHTKLYLSHYL